MIRQPPRRRGSFLARIDRIVSSILAVAFLVTGFQTGYRLTHSAERMLTATQWSLQVEHPSVAQMPVETPVRVTEPLPAWRGTDRLNILVMGLDRRPGSALPGRADVIMIVSVNPVQREVALLSIPRDLWVEVPGHGENRLNSAYFYGEFDGTEGGGPGLMKRTLEHNFGVDIDYYGTLDFECFERIIDILGGITVDVPEPIKDDRYPDDGYGYIRIHIPAGRQQMTGETALQYVRARHETSDFSRMRRQQQVLLAVRDKALSLDVVFSLRELIPLLEKTFSTDLPVEDLLGLANLATQILIEDIQMHVIDESITIAYVAPDGAQVLLPRWDRIRPVMAEMLAEVPDPVEAQQQEAREARILVRADMARPHLASEVADLLQRRGYDAYAQSDQIRIESEGTFIASRRETAETAVVISALLRVEPEFVILSSDVEEGGDLVVTLGRDFVMPR